MTSNPTPTIEELRPLIGYTDDPTTAGYTVRGEKPELGEVVMTRSRGRWYRGIVTKVTPAKAVVTYITEGGLRESEKIHAHIVSASFDESASVAASHANSNFDYYVQQLDPAQRRWTPTEAQLAAFHSVVEYEGRKAFVERKVEEDRQRLAERKADAERLGVYGFATITNKNNKHADIARKAQ